EDGIRCLIVTGVQTCALPILFSGAVGLGVAYGLCWLVDLLPMPDFFAGLLPTWKSGLLACGMLGAIAVLSALFPARRAASVDPKIGRASCRERVHGPGGAGYA